MRESKNACFVIQRFNFAELEMNFGVRPGDVEGLDNDRKLWKILEAVDRKGFVCGRPGMNAEGKKGKGKGKWYS